MGLLFNGTTNFVNCGSSASVNQILNLSVFAVIRPTSVATSPNVAAKFTTADNGWACFLSSVAATNSMRFFRSWSISPGQWRTNSIFTLGEKFNVIYTYDATNILDVPAMYYNGSSLAVTQVNGPVGVSPVDDSTGPLVIGSDTMGNGNYFNGRIFEVAVWDKILTDYEIQRLSRSKVKGFASQISPSNLKAYYLLDQAPNGAVAATSRMFRDISGNGNHGTPVNSPVGAAEASSSYAP